MNRGDIVYIKEYDKKFLMYKIKSVHPEMAAITVARIVGDKATGPEEIRRMNEIASLADVMAVEKEKQEARERKKKATALARDSRRIARYEDIMVAKAKHGDDYMVMAKDLNILPIVAIQKCRAVERLLAKQKKANEPQQLAA